MALAIAVPSVARAQVCMTLSYSFQPDCYRPDAGSACVQTIDRLDLGPQIAVWVQSADGSQFVDTLMVTNLTAVRGIGNRPGRWDFLSAPLFPYGKRQMALPIWAHARGVLYDTVVMTEPICAVGGPNFPAESCLGWHEPYSSPESYYCRPLKPGEINVDAISCASAFHSEKGKLDPTSKSYYPPRGDLTTFTTSDGTDPPTYAAVNDLDAVAAATPAYGAPYTGSWNVPVELAAGDYVVMVEVNKEFDSNAANMHPDYDDPNLPGYGIDGNFGQPSVVYSVPIHIDLTNGTPAQAAVSEIAGYGDWSGATGTITPQDGTISTTDLGSGEERLLMQTDESGVSGRVHVGLGPCLGCNPLPPLPTAVTALVLTDGGLTASQAILSFSNAQANDGPVSSYEIRYRPGTSMTDADFSQAIIQQQVPPGSPGTPASFSISPLMPNTEYVVGVRAFDGCGQHSPIAQTTFKTPAVQFTQLSGCFVATAAWGSALGPEVSAMRRLRDHLRPTSVLFAAATDIYYRSGPAAAEVLRRSDTARALVRRFLVPLGAVAKLATQPQTKPPAERATQSSRP
ncbi:MAG TPA: fibronectin type III domain-containing protein [Polyangia bacterium]|nr:fibronectin type III domain-containing protein [Polyangia bacterium]